MPSPTNYAKPTGVVTAFSSSPKSLNDDSFLLLQDGTSFLLLQDGVSKLILEAGSSNVSAYAKVSPLPTSYTVS